MWSLLQRRQRTIWRATIALAMAVFRERRQMLLQRHFELAPLAAALVQRDVGRHAVHPAGERGVPLEAGTLAHEGQEDVLDDLLGVGLVAVRAACST